MNEPNLLPCPFCGSDDVSLELEEEYYRGYSVDCNNCEANGPFNYFDRESDKSIARLFSVLNWNKRVTNERT